jgi:hypothetical protein
VEDRWWVGNQWPHIAPETEDVAGTPVRLHRIYKSFTKAQFRNWSPQTRATVLLTEFAGQPNWWNLELPVPAHCVDSQSVRQNNTEITNIGPGHNVRDELTELVGLIEYRDAVISEALQQRGTLLGYFQAILPFNTLTHPNTVILANAALQIGQFVAIYHKGRYNRPRPSQLVPALLPPIDVPHHAAYPSAHATEAFLVAHCLNKVMRTNRGTERGPLLETAHTNPPTRNALFDMASRIARNREVMGVHFKTDSLAGEIVAEATFQLMLTCPSIMDVGGGGLIDAAIAEWADVEVA